MQVSFQKRLSDGVNREFLPIGITKVPPYIINRDGKDCGNPGVGQPTEWTL